MEIENVKPNLTYSIQRFINNYLQYFAATLIGFFLNELLKNTKSKKKKKFYAKKQKNNF